PVQRAILAGDAETGITIMQMDAGLDTGAIVTAQPVAIAPDDSAGSLLDKLARVGADLIVNVLRRLEGDGALPSTPQPEQGVTYAAKIDRADAVIDWTADAERIARQVR